MNLAFEREVIIYVKVVYSALCALYSNIQARSKYMNIKCIFNLSNEGALWVCHLEKVAIL